MQTTQNPTGEIRGQFGRSLGTGSFTAPTAPPAWTDDHSDANAASRFLIQTTFGPTTALISQVQSSGYSDFLNQQFAIQPTLHTPLTDVAVAALASGTSPSSYQSWEAWWKNSLTAPDQLRQRVAFALSEIMVTSDAPNALTQVPVAMSSYTDMLLNDAFGNVRQLIEDVTLHPTMGQFLNMAHNDKADPVKGTHPNENYAREVMQLFTIGLNRLNPDGSLALNTSGNPVPTYGQTEITGIARVFTGWNWAQSGAASWSNYTANYRAPMVPVPSHHDGAAKPILGGIVLPSGQSQAQDLKDTLDVIFYHPNFGPFLARELIQRLVTSNPSPGYIYRVASAFNDNGSGVRGDMKAILKAILLDYEARSPAVVTGVGYGHEREPVLRLSALYRAFNASSTGGTYPLHNLDGSLGQTPMHSASVFNFFSPNYSQPGPIAQASLFSPEFQITTDSTVISSANTMRSATFQAASTTSSTVIACDFTPQIALASNPTTLVDSLNTLLMGGQMSSAMRSQVISTVTSISASSTLERAQTAVHLIVTSPQFVIQK
ncbi:MAG: DUF1800 family protein [Chthoniobacteraceae bacterium]